MAVTSRRRTLGVAAISAVLASVASVAWADKYSAPAITSEETFLINDTLVGSVGPTTKKALMVIVAPPWSTKHAFRYAQVWVEFDCAGRRTRFTGSMTSSLANGQFGREDASSPWADAPAATKIGAALTHVCAAAPATMLQGDYDSPDAAAEFVIANYVRMGKPAS